MLGAGGHATVVIDVLRQLNYDVIGLVSPKKCASNPAFKTLKVFTDDDDVLAFAKQEVVLANGIGSLPGDITRVNVHEKFKVLGYKFLTFVAPGAYVSPFAKLSEGVQVMPGSIVNTNAVVGFGTIINCGAIIEHDCLIGAHNHVAPGSTLSGDVCTGNFVHIGTGASVIQGIRIDDHAVVGAGATVNRNLHTYERLLVARPHLIEAGS